MKYFICYYKDYNHYIEEETNERKLEMRLSELINESMNEKGSSLPIVIKGEIVNFNIEKPKAIVTLKQHE